MSPATLSTLHDALEETWRPAAIERLGPFLLRDGQGGGKRVSAATATAAPTPADIDAADAAMRQRSMAPLFRLRPDVAPHDALLDAALAARGYMELDQTEIYVAASAVIAAEPVPPMRVFAVWPPLAVQRDLWAEGGMERFLPVMHRAAAPRTTLMARQADRVAGTAFVAVSGAVAMLHALHVAPALRRRGTARDLTRAAAEWAEAQGAHWLALAVTRDNAAARSLYSGLGMRVGATYHYRQHPDALAETAAPHTT